MNNIEDTPENRLFFSPIVNFTNNRSALCEKTLLDIYLKIKLNSFDINRNHEQWLNAKNELGRCLFKNEEELKENSFYKNWFGASVLTNLFLGSLAFIFYKKK